MLNENTTSCNYLVHHVYNFVVYPADTIDIVYPADIIVCPADTMLFIQLILLYLSLFLHNALPLR